MYDPFFRSLLRQAPDTLTEKPNDALGDLPEWNLGDLYPSRDGSAFTGDLEKAKKDAAAFQERWKGKLSEACTKSGDEGLGAALRQFEALEDLIGRIGSYAGLAYYSDMTDPTNGKFFADTSAAITDMAGNLLFFSLELNRVEDAVLEDAMNKDAVAGHFRPWVEDLRKEKPYQL